MLRFAAALLALTITSSASAASYIDAPTIGRSTTAFSLYGGEHGGGSELSYGHAWESGWALSGVFGGARFATTTEGYGGLGARYVPFDTEISPFVGALFLIDYAHDRERNGVGLATAGRIGVRWREHPFELFGAFEARHTRLTAEDGPWINTRYSIVIGFALEGSAQ
jgi:hypothetical protein